MQHHFFTLNILSTKKMNCRLVDWIYLLGCGNRGVGRRPKLQKTNMPIMQAVGAFKTYKNPKQQHGGCISSPPPKQFLTLWSERMTRYSPDKTTIYEQKLPNITHTCENNCPPKFFCFGDHRQTLSSTNAKTMRLASLWVKQQYLLMRSTGCKTALFCCSDFLCKA